MQSIAAGQQRHALLHGIGQAVDLFPHCIPAAVAVEQHKELVAGKACAHRPGGGIVPQALAGAADVLVAPVVAVGIVDVLEVIQIHHHQRRHAHALRCGEQLGAHPVEGLPVVQPGQDVVIALVLDALPFQHSGGHVLGKADLGVPLDGAAQHDVPHPVRLLNGQQLVALGGAVTGILFPDVLEHLLKAAHAQRLARDAGLAQQGEEIIGHEHVAGVGAQLVAADLHTGHIHDAQKLGGVGHQLPVQLGNGLGKAVHLPDGGAGQVRKGLFLLRVYHLTVQTVDGSGQPRRDQQAAQNAQHQRNQYGSQQHLAHPVGKSQQHRLLHGTGQKPLFGGKGRVAVVQLQRFQHHVIALAAQLQPVAAVAVAAAVQDAQRGICRYQILAGGHGLAQGKRTVCLHIGGGHDKISARLVLVQLGERQFGFQILGKQLHAHHAVHRAVRQNQRHRVGNGVPVVPCQTVGVGSPAAIVFRRKAGAIFIRSLKDRAQDAALGIGLIREGGLPALIRADAQLFYHGGAGAFQQKVAVALRGAGFRVQIPQIDAGHFFANLAGVQIMGVQHDKDAGHLLCAQGVQKLRSKRYQQSIALLAAVIQRIQRDIAAFQQLLGGGGDLLAQLLQILRVPQELLHIAGAVAHPHGKQILGVFVQLPGHVDGKDAGGRHQQLHCQHQHHGRKNMIEHGSFRSVFQALPLALFPCVKHRPAPFPSFSGRSALVLL